MRVLTVSTGASSLDHVEYVFSSPILHTTENPMILGREIYGVKYYTDRMEISKGESITELWFNDIDKIILGVTHSLYVNILFVAFMIMLMSQFSLLYLPFALIFGIISCFNKKLTIKLKDGTDMKLYCTAADYKQFMMLVRSLRSEIQ